MSLRIRRGTDAERSGIVFDTGEIVWTTNSQQLWVGDGITQGGVNILANSAGTGLAYNPTTKQLEFAGASYTTDDIAEGIMAGRQYFTAERAQDAIAAAFNAGSTAGIGGTPLGNVVISYDDTQNLMYATVTLDGIGITSVSADPTPLLGGSLGLNGHTINGTGDINILGTVTATSFTGNIVSSQITSINPVDIGLPASPTYFHVHSNTEQLSVFNGITDNLTPPNIFIETARGSLTSPQTLQAGDQAGGIMFKSFDGTEFKSTANMLNIIAADAVMSDINPKSDLAVYTSAGSSNFQEYVFTGNGVFEAPVLRTTNTYTTSPDTRPTGVLGMIIFETTTNTFQGWNGTNWVTLG